MTSPAFLVAVERVLSHEGGYANNPLDPGRETIWGITARVARSQGYKGEMKYMPREAAIDIYYREYWLPIRGDDLPFPLAFQLFDAAVNSGPPQAIIWLQRLLGVKDDGVFGPITLSAARNSSILKELPFRLIVARGEFQTELPTWPAFGKGWARRNYKNTLLALSDLSKGPHEALAQAN